MKKIWQLFVGDLKRLRSNVVTGIIVLGLIALPSIFSWYNMIAAWDVFGNTGNLKSPWRVLTRAMKAISSL